MAFQHQNAAVGSTVHPESGSVARSPNAEILEIFLNGAIIITLLLWSCNQIAWVEASLLIDIFQRLSNAVLWHRFRNTSQADDELSS